MAVKRYELMVKETFSASHLLRDYEGECARLHGHTWEVEVVVSGDVQEARMGMVTDLKALKEGLRVYTERLDHRHLNEMPPFDSLNPTCENLALWFSERLSEEYGRRKLGVAVRKVTVREGAKAGASVCLDDGDV